MPQTTSDYNYCDVSLWLDDDTGTLRDISGSSNNVGVKLSGNVGILHTFQNQWPRRKFCGKDCVISLTIICSEAQLEAFDLMKHWWFDQDSHPRTFELFAPDKNVGSDKFYGEFVLQDASFGGAAGEGKPAQADLTLALDGTFSWVTNAT